MIRKCFICFILLAIPVSAHCQQKDFRTWFTVELEGELFNLLDISVVPEVRLWDNSSRLEGFLTEADASVPVLKYLRFGLNYRYQADMEDPGLIRNTNRYGIYGQASKKFGDLKITYRALYHQEYTDVNTSEWGKIPVIQHRHKISLKYTMKDLKLSASTSAEMFFTISPESASYQEKLRLSAGMDYEITEKIGVGVGYKYQQEFFKNNPLSSHILCIGFVIKI
jgi:hypothetical protein